MASVTIVIPIRNRASYLPRLFRSLSAVDYEDLEVLLVDNGSSDSSLAQCRAYAQEAPMFVRVLQEPNTGANNARNLGLAQCQTEWIYFFDCDDEFTPSFLGELMPHATTDCDLIVFPTNLVIDGQVKKRSFVASTFVASQILSSTLNTQGMLLRTDFLRKIGGWDSRLQVWQDWELGIRLLLHCPRVTFLPERAYHLLHQHSDSLTGPSMSSRLPAREQTIQIVAAEINDANSRRALRFRLAIRNGMLLREGANESNISLPASWLTSVFSRILTCYTRMGGRGAWRIALQFCKH